MRASLISSPNTGQRTQRTGAGGGQEPELQSSSSLQTERPGSVRSSLMSVLMSLCCEEQAATTRSAALSHMLLHVRASRARTGAVLCNCPNSLRVSHVRAPIIPHGRKRKRRRWPERTRPESVTSNNTRPQSPVSLSSVSLSSVSLSVVQPSNINVFLFLFTLLPPGRVSPGCSCGPEEKVEAKEKTASLPRPETESMNTSEVGNQDKEVTQSVAVSQGK